MVLIKYLQGLSQDPNSLANLDQDLPNNMIHHVPIFSLPQEWLWCETWCSDASKANAKTIDLVSHNQSCKILVFFLITFNRETEMVRYYFFYVLGYNSCYWFLFMNSDFSLIN